MISLSNNSVKKKMTYRSEKPFPSVLRYFSVLDGREATLCRRVCNRCESTPCTAGAASNDNKVTCDVVTSRLSIRIKVLTVAAESPKGLQAL